MDKWDCSRRFLNETGKNDGQDELILNTVEILCFHLSPLKTGNVLGVCLLL